jgi:hypothetical protein
VDANQQVALLQKQNEDLQQALDNLNLAFDDQDMAGVGEQKEQEEQAAHPPAVLRDFAQEARDPVPFNPLPDASFNALLAQVEPLCNLTGALYGRKPSPPQENVNNTAKPARSQPRSKSTTKSAFPKT